MLLKWILWGLVIYWVYRQITGRGARTGSPFSNFTGAGSRPRPAAPENPPAQEAAAQEMVRCQHCGLFLPRNEALARGSDWYCSEAHRREGPA